jgi:hypothetical protein
LDGKNRKAKKQEKRAKGQRAAEKKREIAEKGETFQRNQKNETLH